MPILDNAVNTLGVFRRLAGLAGTIVTMYRHHFGLFWRIMMPVVFLVILFDIATFFRSVKIFEANDEVIKWVEAVKFGWNFNTVTGISPTSGVSSRYEPGVTWELSFNPKLEIISDDAVIWIWHLNFRIFRVQPSIASALSVNLRCCTTLPPPENNCPGGMAADRAAGHGQSWARIFS